MTARAISTLVDRLDTHGIADEALGTWRRQNRRFCVDRPPALKPAGRAWRLGALLLDREGQLYATGGVTRAILPKDFNSDKSAAGEERREIQRAAHRGRFRTGETVNYGWRAITIDEATALVAPVPLEKYINERVDLVG